MTSSNDTAFISISPEADTEVHSPLQDEQVHGNLPRRRVRQQPAVKRTCRVCGDKAFSINFNVVTCESCKAFFRRNALRNHKDLQCRTGKCVINLQTRRSCKKCRLQKCFQVGMIKEWILSDEARNRKREQIERNRAERLRLALLATAEDCYESGFIPEFEDMDAVLNLKPYNFSGSLSLPNFAPFNWQLPQNGLINQQTSSWSQAFQQASAPPFQTQFRPNLIAPLPKAVYSGTLLPIEPAVPTAVSPEMSDDMISVPKKTLISLINRCRVATVVLSNQSEKKSSSSSKSTSTSCACPCRCGVEDDCTIVDEELDVVTVDKPYNSDSENEYLNAEIGNRV